MSTFSYDTLLLNIRLKHINRPKNVPPIFNKTVVNPGDSVGKSFMFHFIDNNYVVYRVYIPISFPSVMAYNLIDSNVEGINSKSIDFFAPFSGYSDLSDLVKDLQTGYFSFGENKNPVIYATMSDYVVSMFASAVYLFLMFFIESLVSFQNVTSIDSYTPTNLPTDQFGLLLANHVGINLVSGTTLNTNSFLKYGSTFTLQFTSFIRTPCYYKYLQLRENVGATVASDPNKQAHSFMKASDFTVKINGENYTHKIFTNSGVQLINSNYVDYSRKLYRIVSSWFGVKFLYPDTVNRSQNVNSLLFPYNYAHGDGRVTHVHTSFQNSEYRDKPVYLYSVRG